MAEILIWTKDNTNPDPYKNIAGCAKKYDILGAKDNGFPWGSAEFWPTFLILRIPSLSKDAAQQYAVPVMENFVAPDDGLTYERIKTRHKYCFNFDDTNVLSASEFLKAQTENWYIPLISESDITDKEL